MLACVAMMISTKPRSPLSASARMSPSRAALNGCFFFHTGCCGASAFTRSRAKASWVYIGCSTHKVPSLSKVAMRCGTGTKPEPSRVTLATKSRIDCFDLPSFHDDNGSLCANAVDLESLAPAVEVSIAGQNARLSKILRIRSFLRSRKRKTAPEYLRCRCRYALAAILIADQGLINWPKGNLSFGTARGRRRSNDF